MGSQPSSSVQLMCHFFLKIVCLYRQQREETIPNQVLVRLPLTL